jgi:phosphohistidine phosphatase
MRLLVVRHAIAEDHEAFARTQGDDAARPLTDEGRRKMARGALGLRQLVPEIDLLATSPLRRAADTAAIIARAYEKLRVEEAPELAPGTPLDRVLTWLQGQPARGTIALVGHEPDLSRLVSALLCGADKPFLELRKGAACLLELTGPPGRGAATLDWLLGPKHLRRLAAAADD